MSTLIKTTFALVAVLAISGCMHKKDKMAADDSAAKSEAAATVEAEATTEAEAMAEEKAMDPMEAAMGECVGEGGSVTNWTDADGESIPACRNADGVEYALRDSAFFANGS